MCRLTDSCLLSRVGETCERLKDVCGAPRDLFPAGKILLLTTCRTQGEDIATTEFICHASRDDWSTLLETNGFLFRIENNFPWILNLNLNSNGTNCLRARIWIKYWIGIIEYRYEGWKKFSITKNAVNTFEKQVASWYPVTCHKFQVTKRWRRRKDTWVGLAQWPRVRKGEEGEERRRKRLKVHPTCLRCESRD